MSRLEGATQAVREAIAAASDIPIDKIGPDDDLIDDLAMQPIEFESLGLILEEVFSVRISVEQLVTSPRYRTPAALAEWCIRLSTEAAWLVSRERRHG